MNDIMLKNNRDGTFDWLFDKGDVYDVTGVQQTVTSIIHAVMLRKNELMQEIYQTKGCYVHEYVRSMDSELAKQLMSESIRESCKAVDGVHDATATITNSDDYHYGVKLEVERDDGRVVEIDAI